MGRPGLAPGAWLLAGALCPGGTGPPLSGAAASDRLGRNMDKWDGYLGAAAHKPVAHLAPHLEEAGTHLSCSLLHVAHGPQGAL